jgi:hypothetical protein
MFFEQNKFTNLEAFPPYVIPNSGYFTFLAGWLACWPTAYQYFLRKNYDNNNA